MLTQQIDLVGIVKNSEWKEMLVNIVTKKKMDPWNVDLVDITENFMGEIKNKQKLNLKVSANVMLAASILLRYKSDTLNLYERQDQELEGAVFIPDEVYVQDPIPNLEPMMRSTQRKVTLDELIKAVENVINKEKNKAAKKRIKIERIVPKTLLEIVTESPESFERELKKVFKKIQKDANGESLSMFSNLIENKTSEGVLSLLLPVLHLANKGKIAIWQEEIFGEIFINLLDDTYESN